MGRLPLRTLQILNYQFSSFDILEMFVFISFFLSFFVLVNETKKYCFTAGLFLVRITIPLKDIEKLLLPSSLSLLTLYMTVFVIFAKLKKKKRNYNLSFSNVQPLWPRRILSLFSINLPRAQ